MPADVYPAHAFVAFEDSAIEQSISARFEQQVTRSPDRLAVVTAELQFTYTELNQVANRLARAILARLGEGEEPVALLFDHGACIIAAILGILKAGKMYVSLDPALPHTGTAYILEDSQARLLLTNAKHLSQAERLAQGGQEILNYEDIDPSIATEDLRRPISPGTCAVILYTSGSTGRPKGVLHNHRNVLVETRNYTNDLRISPEDRLALCHSCTFANSIRNVYGALLNGATLFPYDLASEGFAPLAEWMRTNRITILHTVPTTFRRFLETVAADTTFPALRILRLGGEPINREDVKGFQRHCFSHCVLVHAIGPTETFDIRRYFITHEWHSSDSKIPVGYAVPDKEVLLLDETGREVGADQIGEIAVRSKYLALGYWRRSDLTQAAFIPDPRGGDQRLYLTGDLGMMRPDGCLIHMGRKDFQVKIRGFRIEPGEIEAVLADHPGVRQRAVIVREDEPGEKRLVAYVVSTQEPVPTTSGLRSFLKERLPDYMVPSAFVLLDEMPLSPNGKVDRGALPAPKSVRPQLEKAFVRPRTGLEHLLAGMWQSILGIEQIGIDDNFFELGGSSIQAAAFINKIQEQLAEMIHLVTIFDTPTVADFASYLHKHYPDAVSRICASESLQGSADDIAATSQTGKIDRSKAEQMRELLRRRKVARP